MQTLFDGFSLILTDFQLEQIRPVLNNEDFQILFNTGLTQKLIIRRIEDCIAIESLLGWH